MLDYHPLFCQNANNYEYLIACFKTPNIDSFEREIKGIGKVEAVSLESEELKETGLTYYEIPSKKKNKPSSKLAQLAAEQYIQTWKNNSRVKLYEAFAIGKSSIVDLRLHIIIEDIYVQIMFICDEGKIYEIMCFRAIYDTPHFDALSKKIKDKFCL